MNNIFFMPKNTFFIDNSIFIFFQYLQFINNRIQMSMIKYIPFKVKHEMSERKSKFSKFHEKYPKQIPMVIEPLKNSKLSSFQNPLF